MLGNQGSAFKNAPAFELYFGTRVLRRLRQAMAPMTTTHSARTTPKMMKIEAVLLRPVCARMTQKYLTAGENHHCIPRIKCDKGLFTSLRIAIPVF